jgi:hypothetical protein
MSEKTFKDVPVGGFFISGYDDDRQVLQRVPDGSHQVWMQANYINAETGQLGSCGQHSPVEIIDRPDGLRYEWDFARPPSKITFIWHEAIPECKYSVRYHVSLSPISVHAEVDIYTGSRSGIVRCVYPSPCAVANRRVDDLVSCALAKYCGKIREVCRFETGYYGMDGTVVKYEMT